MLKKLIIESLEVFGFLKAKRWLDRNQLTILMYHRIIDHPEIPGITPEIFEEQLKYIKARYTIMNMRDYLNHPSPKPKNTVILTFDDGHEDFYTNAWPIIKKHGLTASLYITTNFVSQIIWLWPDSIRHILMQTLETIVDLPNIGKLELSPKNLHRNWNILGDYCLTLESSERTQFISQLSKLLNVEFQLDRPLKPFAAVNWEQLAEMVEEGLDVGSHTVTHPILAQLDNSSLENELKESKRAIEDRLGTQVLGLCYPNGMAKDINAQVEQRTAVHYKYGLVAFPASTTTIGTRMGRFGAPKDITTFKIKVNHLSRNKNLSGEYR